ncbi:MAG: hypothetical protein JO252_05630, partial [Planctomycetaceae bacterium]|nr:hypothetical protein [Planctomycetaceae bacterium]
AHVIDHVIQDHQAQPVDGGTPRPINVRALYDYLVADHYYQGSYRSVLRFVRAHYPAPKLRPYRRVETPPGAQAQVDWGEIADIDLGDGSQTLYAFVMVLSHSRKEALIWCRRMDQLAWHHAHNEAFRRLGGIPAVLRIDNLKTGIVQGAGPWGQINPGYGNDSRQNGPLSSRILHICCAAEFAFCVVTRTRPHFHVPLLKSGGGRKFRRDTLLPLGPA